MKRKRIEIRLLSDTCVSDGGIYNSAVDTDICQDDFGFPYIPGKRLKGCLRECALELNDWGAGIAIGRLFGKPGNERGQVVIKNAYIKDRPSKIEVIRQLSGTALCHPQNVLGCYSYIRTQTALDFASGAADDQSLRTIRVANKGLEFEAEVLFLSEDSSLEQDFQKCLSVLRHIGAARTRGLGEVKAVLLEDGGNRASSVKPAPYIENSTRLEYEIYLNEPMVCKSVGEQEAASMDYIEGAKILGLLSQRWKEGITGCQTDETFSSWLQEGELHCSNAYLAVDGRRLYEIPASVFDIKNDRENYRNKVYIEKALKGGNENTPGCDQGLQLNQAKHRYVLMTEDGRMEKHSVEMEERYHHSRPEDKSIGHVQEGADGSQLYQISSIKEGQAFGGFIEGNRKAIKQVYDMLAKEAQCLIGYGRNGEYGGCTIRVTGLGQAESQVEEKETAAFYVLLKSPTIVYNKKAMYATDARDLQEEILAQVMPKGLPAQSWEKAASQISKVEKYMDILPIGGYNVTWGCRKPTIYAFDKGTVFVFHMPEHTLLRIKTGQVWIGERCAEGFGEAFVCPLDPSGSYQGKAVKRIAGNGGEEESGHGRSPSAGNMEGSQEPLKEANHSIRGLLENEFVDKIWRQRFQEFLRFKASGHAKGMLKALGAALPADGKQKPEKSIGNHVKGIGETENGAIKPTISNMMLMCKELDAREGNGIRGESEEKDALGTIWNNCKERFDKKTGRKDKKLKCAEKVIRHVRGLSGEEDLNERLAEKDYPFLSSLMEEFGAQYGIAGMFDSKRAPEWEMAYLKELLIQMKYALRQAEREVSENGK